MSLFGSLNSFSQSVTVELLKPESALAKVDQREVLSWEKELIGVYLSEHPITRLVGVLQEVAKATTADLEEMATGRGVTLAGVITTLRTHTTRKGEAMAFANLEDLRGSVELLFFPRTWKEWRDKVKVEQVLLVRGKVEHGSGEGAAPKIIVDSVDDNPTVAKAAGGDEAYEPPSGNGHGGYAEMAMALEPEPYYEAEARDNGPAFVPPPPPNFEDEVEAEVTAIVEEAAEPPEPAKPITPVAERSIAAPIKPANGQGTGENGQNGNGNHLANRLVMVEVQPGAGWRESFRQSLSAAGRYNGGDRLALSLRGQNLVMEFPGRTTLFCDDLVADLKRVPGVIQVVVRHGPAG
jgi:DNA polymerase-3 subunit alpha